MGVSASISEHSARRVIFVIVGFAEVLIEHEPSGGADNAARHRAERFQRVEVGVYVVSAVQVDAFVLVVRVRPYLDQRAVVVVDVAGQRQTVLVAQSAASDHLFFECERAAGVRPARSECLYFCVLYSP